MSFSVFGKAMEQTLHQPPSSPRTKYLPVTGNGHVDSPGGEKADNSVDHLDAGIDRCNSDTLNWVPDHLAAYCDSGCGHGCAPTAETVQVLDAAVLAKPTEVIMGHLNGIADTMNEYSGEQWVDRVADLYSSSAFSLPAIAERTEAVNTALLDVIQPTADATEAALSAMRTAVRAMRGVLGERAQHNEYTAADSLKLIGWGNPLWAAMNATEIGLATRAKLKAEGAGMEHLAEAHEAMTAAATTNDEAVTKLNQAVVEWKTATHAPDDIPLPTASGRTASSVSDGAKDMILPGQRAYPDMPAMRDTGDGLDDKIRSLGDLLGGSGVPAGMPQMPQMSPMSGGGGMPEMPPMSPMNTAPFDTPLAADRMADVPEAEDTAVPETVPEPEPELAAKAAVEPEVADEPAVADEPEATTDEPEEHLAAPVEAVSSEPVAADPNSPEARTITLPDGKSVEFPNARIADAVRRLLEAEPGSGKSLYTAASEAGFDLPPMGQDIGEKVPASELKVGDIVRGTEGDGVYVGNSEVLMADQSTRRLLEVATFDGGDHGIFRLAEPDHSGDPLVGTAQTVSAVPEAASTETVSTEGAPGVPTDDAPSVQDTASMGSGTGLSSSESALDPNTAFPN